MPRPSPNPTGCTSATGNCPRCPEARGNGNRCLAHFGLAPFGGPNRRCVSESGLTTSRSSTHGKMGTSLRIRYGSMSTSRGRCSSTSISTGASMWLFLVYYRSSLFFSSDFFLPTSNLSVWPHSGVRIGAAFPNLLAHNRSSLFFLQTSFFQLLTSQRPLSPVPHRFPGKRILNHGHQIVMVGEPTTTKTLVLWHFY